MIFFPSTMNYKQMLILYNCDLNLPVPRETNRKSNQWKYLCLYEHSHLHRLPINTQEK